MLRSTPSLPLRTRVRLVLAVFAVAVAAAILLTPSAAVHADDGEVPVEPTEETVVFTDGEGGVFGSGDNFKVYCVYRIVNSSCNKFQPNDVICINCPDNNKCPTTAGQMGNWQYLDADGNVVCSGTWMRRYRDDKPDDCIVCDGGETGYEFVN